MPEDLKPVFRDCDELAGASDLRHKVRIPKRPFKWTLASREIQGDRHFVGSLLAVFWRGAASVFCVGFRLVFSGVFLWLMISSVSAQEKHTVRIYVVGHGWHTGLVIPLSDVAVEKCPGLRRFEGWEYVEIGWGDEGFYRGAESISLGVAFAAAVTPTPTVLHIVGVNSPVEETYPTSEVIYFDVERERFVEMMAFVGATFRSEGGAPVDLGEGIYGFSRFFRAEGSYYFPNTCNVWTLKALKAAGIPVTPVLGIRTENVMDQSEKYGTTIRRSPGRSRVSVFLGVGIAGLLVWRLRQAQWLVPCAWGSLLVAVGFIAVLTMMSVNGVAQAGWLSRTAAFACWAAVAFVLCAHSHALWLRKGSRWRHLPQAILALVLVLLGLSPL